ncbi:MAG: ORF6N domain-containing protein [Deltaproteobacteria bacterium]|nr:ORF6N domain-containing protein [Deltaproteobacteria bacterium]
MFQLNKEEASELSRSQIVTLKRGQNIKYLQHAFTENGVWLCFPAFLTAKGQYRSIFK